MSTINFNDISDNTIMYCGEIDSARDFETKAEWIRMFKSERSGYGFTDFAKDTYGNADTSWHTADINVASIDLNDIIEYCGGDMHEDWDDAVWNDCNDDPLVNAGINRLNELFAENPSYYEGKRVIF